MTTFHTINESEDFVHSKDDEAILEEAKRLLSTAETDT